jgi:hypothetical protein
LRAQPIKQPPAHPFGSAGGKLLTPLSMLPG